MLGYITTQGQGTADRLLAEVARTLIGQGVPVAGVIQENTENPAGGPFDMVLHVLTGGRMIPISQYLGPLSQGCRLDVAALEEAVGLAERALREGQPKLLVVNKFGKQEAEGRGFRPLIGEALGRGVPVLTAVNEQNVDAFLEFSGELGENVAATREAVLDWASARA